MSTSREPRTDEVDWRPRAAREVLRARAEMLASIRAFFAERGVLEVDVPQLSRYAVTDLHLASFATRWLAPGAETEPLYLTTSPELAMKRLLAAGSGPIFQICHAFRNGERGRWHNPEFTMLEWYRPGFDHHALMDEVEELLEATLGECACDRKTYREVFVRATDLDPHRCSFVQLREALEARGETAARVSDRVEATQLLFTLAVEPSLDATRPCFVYDFPADQAALARLRAGEPEVAERFELFWAGLELANGFHELCDAEEQRARFEEDRRQRRSRGLPSPPADPRFLSALAAGLPPCAGVALGIDRLLAAKLGADAIDEVLAFPIETA